MFVSIKEISERTGLHYETVSRKLKEFNIDSERRSLSRWSRSCYSITDRQLKQFLVNIKQEEKALNLDKKEEI